MTGAATCTFLISNYLPRPRSRIVKKNRDNNMNLTTAPCHNGDMSRALPIPRPTLLSLSLPI